MLPMLPINNHHKHRPILLTLSIPIINNIDDGAVTIADFGTVEIWGEHWEYRVWFCLTMKDIRDAIDTGRDC